MSSWRLVDDDEQPVELLTIASGTLIHDRVMLVAGHFTAPIRDLGGVPPFARVFASFSPTNALDRSTWTPVTVQVAHPSIPFCPPPDFCDPTTSDVFEPLQAGIVDVGLVFIEHSPPGVELATLAQPNTLTHPHVPGSPTVIAGYGLTTPHAAWDGKRRTRISTFLHVVNDSWGIWSLPSLVCFGDSGGGILMNSSGEKKQADRRLVANVSDGGIDCRSANNNNRLDTPDVQKWIRKTIDETLSIRGGH